MFDKKYFTIIHWASDKYVNGYYDQSNMNPDILFAFKLHGKTTQFAVECKWRQQLSQDGILWATTEQVERYKTYERTNNITVFIAIGIGGAAHAPNKLYAVPLRALKSNFIGAKYL
jgi:hypothetical protein